MYNATEARRNFFKMLQAVTKGHDATIIQNNTGTRFKLILEEPSQQRGVKKFLHDWNALSLKMPPEKKLKKIIIERRNISL